ncbi:hypothetical protein HY030_03225 [Candidatus Gottesmanbacteria bacterium]|nr:hypothetical protein [Candidatus Gottesmanbacteria bacterium]
MKKSTAKTSGKSVGKVAHFYDHISVAALVLKAPLAVGDTITVKGRGKEFTQTVASMQIDHQAVTKGKKGEDVAIQVDQAVKEGDEITKL